VGSWAFLRKQHVSLLAIVCLPASPAVLFAEDVLPPQRLTPVAVGPLHVEGNRLIDAKARPFLIRGTQLPDFHSSPPPAGTYSWYQFPPYSATTYSAIRQRWNMNAVRVPLDVEEEERTPGYLAEAGKMVRSANQLELLVILAARAPGSTLPSPRVARFWSRCATFFKDYPNVMFDALSDPTPAGGRDWGLWRHGMQELVDAIRAAGARQPVVTMVWNDGGLAEGMTPETLLHDPNIVYEVSPRFSRNHTDRDRDRQFGFLSGRIPVIANDWDLQLDRDSVECASVPTDPTIAEELVEANLKYFDAHDISWTASVFAAGKLITDSGYIDATTLENGWTCGNPATPPAGLGAVVQFHLWGAVMRGLYAVSGAGGLLLPRGSVAIAYGPILAERDSTGHPPLPTELGKVSLQVTDRAGVTRPAQLIYASAGWGQVNFIVPPAAASGAARIALVRADGSRTIANATIVDAAPALWTAFANGRGPAMGIARTIIGGRPQTTPTYRCEQSVCRSQRIRLSPDRSTELRLAGTGFRNVRTVAGIRVEIGGVAVPVVRFGPGDQPGVDSLTVRLPAGLRGTGETDLLCWAGGRVSNPVRINLWSGD
jgi:uncharacterized protein (TIGR03437 family)